MTEPSDFVAPKGAKKKGGACLLGCLGCCTVLVVLIATPLVGSYLVAKHLVESYTDTQPLTIQTSQLSPEDMEPLMKRLMDFKAAMDEGRREEISLSSDEVNAALRAYPDVAMLAEHVYFHLEGDRIRGEISLPMDMFKLPFMKGRYLNGSGEFHVSLEGGTLQVHLLSLTVRGASLPEEAMVALANENLAGDVASDPDMRETLGRIESLQVRDGRLFLVSKGENTESVNAGAPDNRALDYRSAA